MDNDAGIIMMLELVLHNFGKYWLWERLSTVRSSLAGRSSDRSEIQNYASEVVAEELKSTELQTCYSMGSSESSGKCPKGRRLIPKDHGCRYSCRVCSLSQLPYWNKRMGLSNPSLRCCIQFWLLCCCYWRKLIPPLVPLTLDCPGAVRRVRRVSGLSQTLDSLWLLLVCACWRVVQDVIQRPRFDWFVEQGLQLVVVHVRNIKMSSNLRWLKLRYIRCPIRKGIFERRY